MPNESGNIQAGKIDENWSSPNVDVVNRIDDLRRRQATMTGSLDQHEAEIETLKRNVAHLLGLKNSRTKGEMSNAKTNYPWFMMAT